MEKVVEKIKEVFKDKKKVTIIGGSILLVIILIVAIILILGNNNGKSQEKQLKADLEALGREFYEDLYYKNTKDGNEEARAEFLKGFKDQGLKFDLDNLSRYQYKEKETQDKLDTFVNKKTNEECNKKESKVIVYPQDPYGVKDYRVEIILVCGFEEE